MTDSVASITPCITPTTERGQASTSDCITNTGISHEAPHFSGAIDSSELHSGSSHDLSEEEATPYYTGISSDPPKLVYRTEKTPWVKPTDLEDHRKLKKLRGVFGHKINDVWISLGPQVCDHWSKYL